MKTNNPAGALLIILIFLHCCMARAQVCDCERHGKLVEFTNPHSPDYEEEAEEYLNCLKSHLGDQNIKADDPRFSQALQDCESELPQHEYYVWPVAIENRLAERLTTSCFHLYSSRFHNPLTDNEPEYVFKGSYEYKPEGFHTIISDYGEEKLIVAMMEIGLYYNGNSPEPVEVWNSENAVPDYFPLFKRLNIPQVLTPLLDEFERRPVTCNVETKTRMEMCKSGETVIVLTDFEDKTGNSSRSFNRIMVKVRDGTIINGEKSDFGPDFRVFTLENGEVTLKYRKAGNAQIGDKDLLTVYNSCDILPAEKQPLSKTRIDRIIKEEEIPLFCIAIHVGETESGSIKEGDPAYPWSHTVSMQFTGTTINSTSIYQVIPKLPESLRSLVMKGGSLVEECTLIAELLPDEKSMKVEKWECSDPFNNALPSPTLDETVTNYDAPVRIWQIGKKIYVSHLGGILGYFSQPGGEEQMGARPEATMGSMEEYFDVPYEKFINGEKIILHPKDISDHSKEDVWQYQTSWTVTINPD